MTHRHCFNRKFGKGVDQSNSLGEISRWTGIPTSRLQGVYDRVLRETKSPKMAWGAVYYYALSHV